jgi:type III restriction enzyme
MAMADPFFEKPILNSPYAYPSRHWELDATGQPTQKIVDSRRRSDFITPIPKAKKRTGAAEQKGLVFDEGKGLSTDDQRYAHTALINSVRREVDEWRRLSNPAHWRVTPETARLLQHISPMPTTRPIPACCALRSSSPPAPARRR